jgi:hypothetical protein
LRCAEVEAQNMNNCDRAELIAQKVDKVSGVGDLIATKVDKVGGLLIPGAKVMRLNRVSY